MKTPFSLKAALPWLLLLSLSLVSCNFLFYSVFYPNQCQKCELLDAFGSVIWSEDDCAGNIAGMEDRCKVRAYDELIVGRQVRCACETYKRAAE